MRHDPTGSNWSRWDLHFHTPTSFDYEYNSATSEEIVTTLIEKGIAVVAVTDHHTMDVERITEMRALAGDRLTVLPGIELRSELGAKPIHYIGIFDEERDLQELWDRIRERLELTDTDIVAKGGHDAVYVPLRAAAPLFRDELGGVISIHAGSKSNSIEEIRNTEKFQQRIKYDVARELVDLLEVGQLKDVASYVDVVFPRTRLRLPVIVGSDNHDIRRYEMDPMCWIKAEPTFYGLKQLLNEPHDRRYIGPEPPRLANVRNAKGNYLRTIAIDRVADAELNEHWFHGARLDLNHGLVAIIGNQGSGKSALTDILGLLGNSPNRDSFSFLHVDKFRKPRDNKAASFTATVEWHDGTVVSLNLADDPAANEAALVRYVPQFYLDQICDEMKGAKPGEFERELKQVIFSRIPPTNRLGEKDLDSLVARLTEQAEGRADEARADLGAAARRMAHVETRATDEYRANLAASINGLKKQLASLDEEKPKPMRDPAADENAVLEQTKVATKLRELDSEIVDLRARCKAAEDSLGIVGRKEHAAKTIREKVSSLAARTQRLQEEIRGLADSLGIDAEGVFTLETSFADLREAEAFLRNERTRLEPLLAGAGEASISLRIAALDATARDRRLLLNKPGRDYEQYLDARKEWDQQRARIIGDKSTPGTLSHFEALQNQLQSLPDELASAKAELLNATRRIYEEKRKILDAYADLYRPVQEFIDSHQIARERFGLQFSVSFSTSAFVGRLLNLINQGRRGSYNGEIQGRLRALEQLAVADFGAFEGVDQFLEVVWTALHADQRHSECPEVPVEHQLRDDFETTDIYEFLFGLSYLEPRYRLEWEGRPLELLSPGQRGTLLLIFFLLIDEGHTPLIIDQPEGNLDNQTVFELLVDCIKEAKERRQVVIVTHNPNLAVVCDAEQVIYCELDKEADNRVTYVSGALENPLICRHIVDILEGTKPAIDNRMAKYKVIFDQD